MRKQLTGRIKPTKVKNKWDIFVNLGWDEIKKYYPIKRKKFTGNRWEAEAFLRDWIYELENPDITCYVTLSEWLLEWLKTSALPNQEKTSYERVERLVRKNIIPWLGHIPLGALNAENVKNYYATLLEKGKIRITKDEKGEEIKIYAPLSKRTVQYCHIVLNQALNEAVTLGKIPSNPAKGIKPPKDKRKPKEKMHALDANQLKELLEKALGHRDYVIIFVAAYSGARQSELIGLTWDKIWFHKSAIRIERTIHLDKESETGFEERERTKNDPSTRTVIMSKKAMDLFKSVRPKDAKKDDLVFQEKGGPLNRQNLTGRFENLAAKHGYPDMTFHDLRHTHATILLSDGANINEVAERLGHADPTITLRTYGHVLPGRDETLANRFDSLMD